LNDNIEYAGIKIVNGKIKVPKLKYNLNLNKNAVIPNIMNSGRMLERRFLSSDYNSGKRPKAVSL
jgi:hypothetical protein